MTVTIAAAGLSVTIPRILSGSQFILALAQDARTSPLRSVGCSSGNTRNTSRQPGKPFNLSKPMLATSQRFARRERMPATSGA
jgi:hypothetical protein